MEQKWKYANFETPFKLSVKWFALIISNIFAKNHVLGYF